MSARPTPSPLAFLVAVLCMLLTFYALVTLPALLLPSN